MIRFRTKDITRLWREECSCGRTLIKMEKVTGRTDDMLIVSGVNIFPSQIESLLLEMDEIEPQYVIVVKKKGYLDELTVRVEAKKGIYEAGPEKCAEVEKKIATHIKGMLGVGIKVNLVEPKVIARSEGKAQRVIDER
jgi:phenylacetate-CoA ligase